MQTHEPLYQFTSRAGKYTWFFAAYATWVLGFLTWQVMYLIEKVAPGQASGTNLPGPNSFTSVLIGDCLVVPAINAFIVLFYRTANGLGREMNGTPYSRILVAGGPKQNVIAAIIGIVTTVGTYSVWFVVKKVDWSIPAPGVLNAAGAYHAIFMATEIYFVSNFILSFVCILINNLKSNNEGRPSIELQRRWANGILRLVRIFGGIGIATDVFTLSLLIDVHHHLIPVAGYFATAILILLLIIIGTLIIILGVYRWFLNIFFRDVWAPLLLLIAVAGAAGQFLVI